MRHILACLLLLTTLTACATKPSASEEGASAGEPSVSNGGVPAARSIARTYGIDGWGDVEMIEFTFNVQAPNRDKPAARHWLWDVKSGYVQRSDEQSVITFKEADPHEDAAKAHQQFINDSYWFLFPFQLVWSNPTVTDAGVAPLPIGGDDAAKVICQWPAEGGYTPGDAYDLYLGYDGRITQWVFRRGGDEKGSAMTWDDHAQLGPILVCTNHENADGTFRLWFTDVRLKLVGEDAWIEPTLIEE